MVAVADDGVGLHIRVARRVPTFPPEMWNVSEATLADGARTNNVSESFNNR